ncbi:MAG: 4'-phosphopantetheinyl transferase family protein [Bacteroidales bacterium]
MDKKISIIRDIQQAHFRLMLAKYDSSELSATIPFLSEIERTEFLQLKNSRRKAERAVTLYLLHQILDVQYPLAHHDNGAPYLEGADVQISISHTKEYLCIALHQQQKIAVDIEPIERNMERVVERILSPREHAFCHTPQQRCLIWCAKEVIFKLVQSSNVNFSKHICVEAFTAKDEGVLCVSFTHETRTSTYQLQYTILQNIALVYASTL